MIGTFGLNDKLLIEGSDQDLYDYSEIFVYEDEEKMEIEDTNGNAPTINEFLNQEPPAREYSVYNPNTSTKTKKDNAIKNFFSNIGKKTKNTLKSICQMDLKKIKKIESEFQGFTAQLDFNLCEEERKEFDDWLTKLKLGSKSDFKHLFEKEEVLPNYPGLVKKYLKLFFSETYFECYLHLSSSRRLKSKSIEEMYRGIRAKMLLAIEDPKILETIYLTPSN